MSQYSIQHKQSLKIKTLDEAFKKYISEEDLINYSEILMEESAIYKCNKSYNMGDIVYVVQYLYTNGQKGFGHLFVIIDKQKRTKAHRLGLLISSKIYKTKYNQNILLPKDKYNNLNKDSIVKTDEIYKLNKNNILFKVGIITPDLFNKYRIKSI